jgi:hypothetical protein
MRSPRVSALVLGLGALLGAGHAAALVTDRAYAATPTGTITTFADADRWQADPDGLTLAPGEFAWLPAADAPSQSPVTVLVSLRNQRAYVYRDGERIAVTTVSTGLPGHDTPPGVFPIMSKEKMHHSNKYDNAPMPWMQRLTQWGHALHAGHVRAGPASHGCVRLPAEFARQLYSITHTGDLVVIADDDSMISLERAGVDSQVAALVGSSSRLAPNPEGVLARGDSAPQSGESGAAIGVAAY